MEYIPQAPPFEMIDELLRADDKSSQTQFLVREGHLFVDNGFFSEPGLIENMAQTAAAGTGYNARQKNETPPVGFIGAIKGLKIYSLPAIGEEITTTIVFLHQVMNAHIVDAEIHCSGKLIAKAEFKIFLQ